MDLALSDKDLIFREHVRAWIRDNLCESVARKVRDGSPLTKDDIQGWAKTLGRKGWLTFTWPAEYGGTGWTAVQTYLFLDECGRAHAPQILPFGPIMLAPLLVKFGNVEQRERLLPGIASGETWWCQGFSEPNSGSDLASLSMKAERCRASYRVNGQKTWTSFAQHGDWIFCLVRVFKGQEAQPGLTFLLIDLRSSGITIRPIELLDGSREVSEVWFDDVEVPVENRLGEENKGWACAQHLLVSERSNSTEIGKTKQDLARLKRLAREYSVADDTRIRDEIAKLSVDITALDMLLLRVIASTNTMAQSLEVAAMLKLRSGEIHQRCTELQMLVAGPQALPVTASMQRPGAPVDQTSDRVSPALVYANWRKATIYGGTNEIQKNIIAQELLK